MHFGGSPFDHRLRIGENLFHQGVHFGVVPTGVVASDRNDIQSGDTSPGRLPFGQARQGVPAHGADVRQNDLWLAVSFWTYPGSFT